MTDFHGLQIDIRCIRCGRLPTAEITLYEMQNHLYICNICGQQATQAGKQIKWVTQPDLSASPTGSAGSNGARVLTNTLLPNSLFAVLGLPLTASLEEVEAAIKQRMRQLLREEDSPERTQSIEQLHEWQEKTEDDATFEEYRASFKAKRSAGQALSVGGGLVYSVEEFLSACEDTREGWADGERYLRLGQLQHWVIFQVENRELASKIRYYQSLKNMAIFRAFNETLYCMVPERPFRFYKQEAWEAPAAIISASTPTELAQRCDLNWWLGTVHLYEGSLAYWLGDIRGIAGLKDYYKTAVSSFANKEKERGLGLELLLEKALPALPRPQLVVTFDGNEGEYALNGWDRELPHQPITVKVINATRGFTSIDLQLEQQTALATQWITLNNGAPIHISGTPGDGAMPAIITLPLMNLALLQRGKKYRRTLTLTQAGEPGQPPVQRQFPITIKMQRFYAGFRGILWRWGLRGGLVGLGWNFGVGALVALLLYALVPAVVPASYLYGNVYSLSFASCMQMAVAGAITLLRAPEIPLLPSVNFPVIAGAIIGLVGFGVGNGKGHSNYSEKRGAAQFRKWGFWFVVVFVVELLVVDLRGITTTEALQYGGMGNVLAAFFDAGGSILLGILTLFIVFLVASIRYRAEKYLRTRYKELLNPQGRI